MKNYLRECKNALLKDWFAYVRHDAVSGNGFVIFAYGLRLIATYALWFLFRVLLALLFPLCAFLLLKAKDSKEERLRKRKETADRMHE